MTHKVGPKGQVAIPKHIRDELGISPGDEVVFELRDYAVLVMRKHAHRSGGAAGGRQEVA
jgi:AbrB family looped-hinge helix DNA binding protein